MSVFQKDPSAQAFRDRFNAQTSQERVKFLNQSWDILDASPTDQIDVVQGWDQDGLEQWVTFAVGDLVCSSESGEPWRIVGFTRQNLVLTRPHGIRSTDDCRSGITFDPTIVGPQGQRLVHFGTKQEPVWRHQDGLVTFG